jgi:hypothetical protein
VSKVKKRAAVTGVRNTRRIGKAQKTAGRTTSKTTPVKRSKPGRAATSKRPIRGSKGVPKKPRPGRLGALAPIARYEVKPLDPIRKCGPGTSVQFLYLVHESVEGKREPHLVFFDHHGWYCVHGRTCPAVAPARKYNGHIARVS